VNRGRDYWAGRAVGAAAGAGRGRRLAALAHKPCRPLPATSRNPTRPAGTGQARPASGKKAPASGAKRAHADEGGHGGGHAADDDSGASGEGRDQRGGGPAKAARRSTGGGGGHERRQQARQRPSSLKQERLEEGSGEEDAVEGDAEDGEARAPRGGKRQRRSSGSGGRHGSARQRAPASDEDDGGGDDGSDFEEQRQRRRRREQDEHADMEAELDEEARLARAMAAHEEQLRAAGGAGGVAREKGLAGHVKSIKLVNFMCHQNFEMVFRWGARSAWWGADPGSFGRTPADQAGALPALPLPRGRGTVAEAPRPPRQPVPRSSHVNFISGQNGSGKSAVLQALQICLGATARETGRGKNLRELIRSGADEARLSVTLWNTGADAYQHDRLGDWVSIERRVTVAGGGAGGDAGGVSTTWAVTCAKCGRVKGATRKNLIEPMLDHLNIAAENPLCVMTQVRHPGRRGRGLREGQARGWRQQGRSPQGGRGPATGACAHRRASLPSPAPAAPQDKAREFLSSVGHSRQLLYRLFMDATLMGDFKAKLQKTQVWPRAAGSAAARWQREGRRPCVRHCARAGSRVARGAMRR
jgi:hypothetical protein